MSSYFPILIAHDPAAALPPKPLPVDDLQGRLCCCRRSTEELITRQRRGFVLSVRPSLALERERKRNAIEEEEEVLSLPRGLTFLSLQIVLATSWPRPSSSRPSAAPLVYRPIMTLSPPTMRPLIARCPPSQWMNGGVTGKDEFVPLSSPSLFGGALLLGPRVPA